MSAPQRGERRGPRADGRAPVGRPAGDDANWASHAAALDALAEHRRRAEAAGWTACAIERDGGSGPFQLFGVPPGGALRTRLVPGDAEAPGGAMLESAAAERAVRRQAAAYAAAHAPDRAGAGGPMAGGADAAPLAESRERLARAGEPARWQAQDAAWAALGVAVAAYTRALRAEGHTVRRTVVAVAAAVRAGATPALAPDPLAVVLHGAGCQSVGSYYTR